MTQGEFGPMRIDQSGVNIQGRIENTVRFVMGFASGKGYS